MMSSIGSVSVWIQQLQAGEESALGKLHARYWPFVVGLARRKLGGMPRRALDEEDTAQQAFWSFYKSLRAGGLPQLSNRSQLLALLSHITACQAANQIKHELGVQKRGGGRVQGESVLKGDPVRGDGAVRGLEQMEDAGLSPEERILLKDCYQHYVAALPGHLRDFAELYLAGLTYQEIADRRGCTERTVDRKMALILGHWRRLAEASLNQEVPDTSQK
jgi:DNA-directed RNA polymerase specialized sigma24 family protein